MNPSSPASRPVPLLPIFRAQGLRAMVRAYESNDRFSLFRLKQDLWQGLTGVRFKNFIDEIDAALEEMNHATMAQAAWDFLARIGFPITADWRFDKERLRNLPVIFYARHPSYIEPMACLAALKEIDPQIVATAWLSNIDPGVARRFIGVPDSKEATLDSLRAYAGVRKVLETIWAHVLTLQVVRHLQGDMSADECRRRRKEAVTGIVSTLAERQPILLFPSGGEAQKPWVGEHTGYFDKLLRIILASRKRSPALDELRFVPIIIHGTVRTLFKSRIFMRWHPVALPFRFMPDRPYRFIMKEEVLLKDLLEREKDPKAIVAELMQRLHD